MLKNCFHPQMVLCLIFFMRNFNVNAESRDVCGGGCEIVVASFTLIFSVLKYIAHRKIFGISLKLMPNDKKVICSFIRTFNS